MLGGQGVLGTAIAVAFGAAGWTSIRAGRRPEEACTIGELRSALAESDIVVVDEQ